MRAFRLGLVGCGLLLLPGALWAQTIPATFEVSATTAVDGRPVAVAMADVNDDKHLDVITANADTALISVLTGDGSGILTFAGSFDAGTVPMGLAIADFDGDEKPDVLVSNANSGTISFLKGDGTGGFTLTGEPIVLPGACSGDTTTACDPDARNQQGMDQCEVAGIGTCTSVTGPGAMAVGDLSGDGLPDVAIANEGSGDGDGKLSILISNGDGTFEGLAPIVAGSKTGEVVIDDFNGDGHNDVAVANNGGDDVAVFLGDGHGHLSARIGSTIGVPPTGLSAGDVNEDGHKDLVVSTAAGITVMLGDGQGHFTAGGSFTAGNTPSAVVAVDDLNGDGHLDVAVSNSRSVDASVLLGDGTGSFGPARTFVADGEPLSIAAGDLNEDGLPDIVTGDALDIQQGSVAVFLNQGMGRLLGVEDLDVGVVTAVASGDIDNDSLPDIAVTFGSSASSSLRVYLARGVAGFLATDDVPVGQGASAVVLADFNRDGNLDAATVNNEGSDLSILRGRGDGTFEAASQVATPTRPVTCTVGDFNHDRIPDLAVVSIGDPGSIKIFLGMGDGTFQPGNSYVTQNAPVSVALGLFNDDAFEDLAIANSGSDTVTVLFGTGNGNFTAAPTVTTGRGPVGVAVLDANRDGIDDLAVAQSTDQNVLVYFGKGDGTFTVNNQSSAGDTPSGLVVRDLNGDGRPDMAVANQVSNNVSMLLGTSTGRFTRTGRSITVSRQPKAIAGADFNGDGRYDVTTGNAANTAMNVSVIKNSTASVTLVRGDGNQDGRVGAADLVAAQRAAAAVDRGRPEDIFQVGFDLGPGVDANGDGIITPQDTRATVTRIFLPTAGV